MLTTCDIEAPVLTARRLPVHTLGSKVMPSGRSNPRKLVPALRNENDEPQDQAHGATTDHI